MVETFEEIIISLGKALHDKGFDFEQLYQDNEFGCVFYKHTTFTGIPQNTAISQLTENTKVPNLLEYSITQDYNEERLKLVRQGKKITEYSSITTFTLDQEYVAKGAVSLPNEPVTVRAYMLLSIFNATHAIEGYTKERKRTLINSLEDIRDNKIPLTVVEITHDDKQLYIDDHINTLIDDREVQRILYGRVHTYDSFFNE